MIEAAAANGMDRRGEGDDGDAARLQARRRRRDPHLKPCAPARRGASPPADGVGVAAEADRITSAAIEEAAGSFGASFSETPCHSRAAPLRPHRRQGLRQVREPPARRRLQGARGLREARLARRGGARPRRRAMSAATTPGRRLPRRPPRHLGDHRHARAHAVREGRRDRGPWRARRPRGGDAGGEPGGLCRARGAGGPRPHPPLRRPAPSSRARAPSASRCCAKVPGARRRRRPIGGGGLNRGHRDGSPRAEPDVRIIGVEAALYPSAYAALAGVEATCGGATLAEGIAVKTPGRLTLPIIADLVERIVLVDEPALEARRQRLRDASETVAEGAGAAGLAAMLTEPELFAGLTSASSCCGGNIDPRILPPTWCASSPQQAHRHHRGGLSGRARRPREARRRHRHGGRKHPRGDPPPPLPRPPRARDDDPPHGGDARRPAHGGDLRRRGGDRVQGPPHGPHRRPVLTFRRRCGRSVRLMRGGRSWSG